MGMSPFSDSPSGPPKAPEPIADQYQILETSEINGWTIAIIHYTGCTTYGGNKLMVFDVSADVVRDQKFLDPHFLEVNNMLSPVARFEPTDRGRELAHLICTERTIWE